ncbi:MAG TPA: DUF3572 domain-containing protein [Xanthobacteraceae bacterium]|nr:DUF3572 domain-containing protein [Xanthobacteraceae bacterium]
MLLSNNDDSLRIGKRMPESRRTSIDREAAEMLAIQALAFIAADHGRLGRFLAMTGLDPARIRTFAQQPQFLAGVLDYLAGDDRLALEFARYAALDPHDIAEACAALGGRRHERDLP